jgi:hypothetical protein
MLDLIGTSTMVAVIAVNLNATVTVLQLSSVQTLATVTAAGLWIGLAIALAGTEAYAAGPTPVPVIGVMAALPVLAAALAALLSARVRTALLGLPVTLLVGLNVMRIEGLFFLLLSAQGRLSGPFPLSAGRGDILVGLAAIPLMLALARNVRGHRGWLLAWNLVGTLDLLSALTLGILSAPGSPFQLFGGTIGSSAIWTLPWSAIPTLLVPFYLVIHGIIFARLMRAGEPVAAWGSASRATARGAGPD